MEQKHALKANNRAAQSNSAPKPLPDSSTAENLANPPVAAGTQPAGSPKSQKPLEIGGPSGPEPTRYGDWERNGRVSDF